MKTCKTTISFNVNKQPVKCLISLVILVALFSIPINANGEVRNEKIHYGEEQQNEFSIGGVQLLLKFEINSATEERNAQPKHSNTRYAGLQNVRRIPELNEYQRIGCLMQDITDRNACIAEFSQCEGGQRNLPEVTPTSLYFASCPMPTEPPTQTQAAPGEEAEPIVIYLSVEEFNTLPVEAPVAQLGPPGGHLPVGLESVAYAEASEQIIETEVLGVAVTVRAVPVSFEWHFGDGTVLTTDFPGRPWPERDVSMRYRAEGWYETHLITTFAGEFSVDGGEFQPIIGTITRQSGRSWVYSDALTARLVEPGSVTEEDRKIPERTAETLGPINGDAEVKTLKKPRTERWWDRNG